MTSLVVYESMYGNTREVAYAIADGLGGATCLPVSRAPESLEDFDLLVVGGPTHAHGMASDLSRRGAADDARKQGHELVRGATDEPGLRTWLAARAAPAGLEAAAFDTRLARSRFITGSAANGIARRLRRRGFAVVASESFLVGAGEGPLEPGEVERAREWGAELAARPAARPLTSA